MLGGDGRYYNDVAIQTILRMAAANGVATVLVGRGGILSTPAVSDLIRRRGAFGGIVLSASHNPGGPDGDFGIKYNIGNGGPAPEKLTNAIHAAHAGHRPMAHRDQRRHRPGPPGRHQLGAMQVEVVDPVADYAALMEQLVRLRSASARCSRRLSHALRRHACRDRPLCHATFWNASSARRPARVINGVPLPDFGGGHPDPNPTYAHDAGRADVRCRTRPTSAPPATAMATAT